MKKCLCILCLLLLSTMVIAEEDFSLNDLHLQPTFQIMQPLPFESYQNGGKLKVELSSNTAKSYQLILQVENEVLEVKLEGTSVSTEFSFIPTSQSMELRVTAFENENFTGINETKVQTIISPKEELIQKMIDLAFANSKDKKYNFAPAEEDHHIGVCKNFVMRLFDTFSKDYRMQAYPDLSLHMPKNRSLLDSKPYQYGLEWRIESATDGSPFEIVEQFKYDKNLNKEENYKKAYALMPQIKKGDFFQMVGNYGGGNGPHSLFFIEDYDQTTDNLHWTDSNMFGKRVNGIRWGYMQFNAIKTGEWFANVFNSKDRGATIYRLRDDLIKP